jgi:hypothetical protein
MFEKEAEEYADFLKHLGIKKELMVADMRSKLPDYEKPVFVKRCKDFEDCESRKHYCCKGCNIWNYLYDIKELQKWCKEHGKDFMLFTMDMQKKLKQE